MLLRDIRGNAVQGVLFATSFFPNGSGTPTQTGNQTPRGCTITRTGVGVFRVLLDDETRIPNFLAATAEFTGDIDIDAKVTATGTTSGQRYVDVTLVKMQIPTEDSLGVSSTIARAAVDVSAAATKFVSVFLWGDQVDS